MNNIELRQTEVFATWLAGVRDRQAVNRILVRLKRLQHGHVGDARSVGDNVHELRIHHGPGYRVYFVARGQAIVVLLCGGDKRTQQSDIQRAKRLARTLE